MLVIGFHSLDNFCFPREIAKQNSPQDYYDQISMAAKNIPFDTVLVIENDEIIEQLVAGEDYDIIEQEELEIPTNDEKLDDIEDDFEEIDLSDDD